MRTVLIGLDQRGGGESIGRRYRSILSFNRSAIYFYELIAMHRIHLYCTRSMNILLKDHTGYTFVQLFSLDASHLIKSEGEADEGVFGLQGGTGFDEDGVAYLKDAGADGSVFCVCSWNRPVCFGGTLA